MALLDGQRLSSTHSDPLKRLSRPNRDFCFPSRLASTHAAAGQSLQCSGIFLTVAFFSAHLSPHKGNYDLSPTCCRYVGVPYPSTIVRAKQ